MRSTPESRRLTLPLVVILASLLVVGIGVQAYLANRDADARAEARAAQDRRDDAYADCLTEFAADLVDTIKVNAVAGRNLNEARDRKDAALDRLLELSLTAQQSGATSQEDVDPALLAEYERVLTERVAAQRRFAHLKADFDRTVAENPYVSPKVACKR